MTWKPFEFFNEKVDPTEKVIDMTQYLRGSLFVTEILVHDTILQFIFALRSHVFLILPSKSAAHRAQGPS